MIILIRGYETLIKYTHKKYTITKITHSKVLKKLRKKYFTTYNTRM